jgi:hypothetical protein
MALGYATALRNAQLDQVTARMDAGSGAALLRIYDGSRPATGGSATTLLAQLTLTDPSASSASSGVLTLSSIAQDASADATGTATWFRIVQSDGSTHVMDGSVTATGGGGDLTLNSTSITTGGTVSVTSFTITAGNA